MPTLKPRIMSFMYVSFGFAFLAMEGMAVGLYALSIGAEQYAEAVIAGAFVVGMLGLILFAGIDALVNGEF